MRRFSLGSSTDRKIVVLEVVGARMSVVRMKPDGTTTRQEKELPSESEARAASETVAHELLARGYVEHDAKRTAPAPTSVSAKAAVPPPKPSRPAPKPAPPVREFDDEPPSSLFDDLEPASEPVAPLARLAPLPDSSSANGEPKKKKTGKKKKKKSAGESDGLDKRVLAGVGGVALLLVCGLGYIAYDVFLKPASIIGKWGGSMVEHEISRSLTHTGYDLVLDAKKNASMTINGESTTTGTYSVKGNRLKLILKDEDGETNDREFKIKLGASTLDLMDPQSGKLIVQLIRLTGAPAAGGKAKADAKAAAELVDKDAGKSDPAADLKIASVELSAKDGAFRLRHPQGWETDTGARPDNTYSYIILTKDPAKIQIYADIQGSLMSGSDSAGQFEEGSELAPVHRAHEMYKKVAAGELSEYQEGKPDVFKGSGLGEGRISLFKASGGLFGSNLKGYHVTLLTKDRRLSVLAYGPEKDFEKLKPAYLAVCRSLGH
ncbi:hypothetical protein [Paludisphaera borealis]|uniref:Uncharacterized protein n=1 Tax=Paludisphaera borealis TaxID=1387353 RepID=A0A1U7CV11_9BACT|nr:hypothetical protein [Paludisphaera borealis]APW62729.1 hypothetical protein BSF38_04281 [Paludisphaera borealis]